MIQNTYPIHWSDRMLYSFFSVGTAYLGFQTTYKMAKLAIVFFETASFSSLLLSFSCMTVALTLGKHLLILSAAMAKYTWHIWNNEESNQLPPWNIKIFPEGALFTP